MINKFELKRPETFVRELLNSAGYKDYDRALQAFILNIRTQPSAEVSDQWIRDVITHLVKGKLLDTECDICGKFAMESIDVIDPDQEANQ